MRKPEEMTKEEYSAIMNSSSISLIRSMTKEEYSAKVYLYH